jgi:GMP synthase (glutamine-hydrolysing)
MELTITKEDEIFNGVPKKSVVWLSHNDEVTRIPEKFELLASSESCKIQAMRHKEKQLYGLQFHPEVEHTEYGEQIFNNFVKICSK